MSNKGTKEKFSPKNVSVKFKTLKGNENILKTLRKDSHHLEAKKLTLLYAPLKTED